MTTHYIHPDEKLTFHRVFEVFKYGYQLALSEEAKHRINHCRSYLDEKTKNQNRPVYGVNTGFGSLCDVKISNSDLEQLQENLVKSHACGTGDEVPEGVVKIMLFLKVQSLSYGHSGVQLKTVNRLLDMYNSDILPVVYQQGSLGASGDLAPLAHLALPLIGKGEVNYQGKRQEAAEVLKQLGWEPISLKSKEGLALLNGTQFMAAFGVYSLIKLFRLSQLADIAGAISLESFDGRGEPFTDEVHQIRRQEGQIKTAEIIREILQGSELIKREKQHVQDPYSFRCIPQVHGASKDAINYVARVFSNEINAVTDNPTIFPDKDLIISAGNFHGQPLAISLDYLTIAIAELGSISERRTYQLLDGKRGLPSFLIAKPGLNSGFMIPQYTAASIVSQNKHLANPASVDSIVSSQGQEDHVSMGANAATKAYQAIHNLERILAIEVLVAAQAMEFRRPLKSSPFIESFLKEFRGRVPFVENDEVLYKHIGKAVKFAREVEITLPDGLTEGI